MKPDYKLVAKTKYTHLTPDLAAALWQECYKKFYPPKQLDALVQRLQSAEAIEEDIDGQANYFVVQLGGKPIGYFAWKMENTALCLMGIYLKPEYRGKALGQGVLSSCERLARAEGKGRVFCAVPTRSLPVIQFFKAQGYRPVGPADQTVEGILLEQTEMERILR